MPPSNGAASRVPDTASRSVLTWAIAGANNKNNSWREVIMKNEWQDVLDRFHYGIYLVTVSSPEGQNGMIASWVTQCSHEPPLVAMAIRKNRLAHEQILKSRKFCLNVPPRAWRDPGGLSGGP